MILNLPTEYCNINCTIEIFLVFVLTTPLIGSAILRLYYEDQGDKHERYIVPYNENLRISNNQSSSASKDQQNIVLEMIDNDQRVRDHPVDSKTYPDNQNKKIMNELKSFKSKVDLSNLEANREPSVCCSKYCGFFKRTYNNFSRNNYGRVTGIPRYISLMTINGALLIASVFLCLIPFNDYSWETKEYLLCINAFNVITIFNMISYEIIKLTYAIKMTTFPKRILYIHFSTTIIVGIALSVAYIWAMITMETLIPNLFSRIIISAYALCLLIQLWGYYGFIIYVIRMHYRSNNAVSGNERDSLMRKFKRIGKIITIYISLITLCVVAMVVLQFYGFITYQIYTVQQNGWREEPPAAITIGFYVLYYLLISFAYTLSNGKE